MAEKRTSSNGGPKYPIESVDSALKLMRLIADDNSVTVTSAAHHLGVSPSTAHRLLAMLQHHGVIEQRTGKTYELGPWLIDLALRTLGEVDVGAVARPHVQRLVDRVGETAHVVALQGTEAVFLDCVECTHTLRATARTGQRLPAHCTAGGKAQLAELPPERLIELYPHGDLPGLTPKSLTKRRDLLRELDRVRANGYATNKAESEIDLNAVAAAIRDPSGTPRGAVTIAGPPARMKAADMAQVGEAVIATAAAIGAELPAPSHAA